MAHKLDFSKGSAAIAYNIEEGTPWHKEGVAINGRFDAEVALDKGGLNFEVELQDIQTTAGTAIAGHRAVVRTDTNTVLGVTGGKYAALQNRDAAAFFNPLMTDNKAIFETAGSLDEGRTIWLLAKLDADPVRVIADDVIEKYLLFTNNHTGMSAAKARFTPIRVVCANTLGWAMERGVRQEVVVKHVGDVAERVKFAGEILAKAGKFYNELEEGYQAMAKINLTSKQIFTYIKESLRPYKPSSATDEELELLEEQEQDSARLKTEIDNVTYLIENGRGSDIKGIRGTLWGTYNAITEYVDHYKSNTSRLSSTEYLMNGVGNLIKKKAIAIATDHIKRPTKSKLALIK